MSQSENLLTLKFDENDYGKTSKITEFLNSDWLQARGPTVLFQLCLSAVILECCVVIVTCKCALQWEAGNHSSHFVLTTYMLPTKDRGQENMQQVERKNCVITFLFKKKSCYYAYL